MRSKEEIEAKLEEVKDLLVDMEEHKKKYAFTPQMEGYKLALEWVLEVSKKQGDTHKF